MCSLMIVFTNTQANPSPHLPPEKDESNPIDSSYDVFVILFCECLQNKIEFVEMS